MTTYYTVPTTIGAAKIAAAASAEATLTLLEFAVGDANGTPYLPETRVAETTLVNERYRAAIQTLTPDPSNASVYIAKCRLPADVGDFEVSEIALIDADNDLIYLANYPRTFKPVFSQGAGGELIIKLYLLVTQAGVLELIADPNVITLTQSEGDSRYTLKTELADENADRIAADLSLAISLAAEITIRESKTNTATETTEGISRLATLEEVLGGLVSAIVTPATLSAAMAITQTTNQISFRLPNGLTVKMGRHHIGDLIGASDPEYTDEFDEPFSNALFAFIHPYVLGGTGVSRFFMHKRRHDNSSITVVTTEIESVVQNCGFDWIAVGFQ